MPLEYETITMAEAVPLVIEELAERQKDPEKYRGLKFMHPGMDRLTGGVRATELVVVTGPPNIGKTTWMVSAAINYARQVAINNHRFGEDRYVGVITLEESIEQLVIKSLSNVTSIEMAAFRDLTLDDAEWSIIANTMDDLTALPIVLDSTGVTIPQLRKLHEKWNFRVNLLDYFTRMGYVGPRKEYWEVNEYNAMELKTLAKDFNCSEIVLAHKTHSGNTITDKQRSMSELAGGQALSREADVIMHILPCLENGREVPNLREVYFAKCRNSGALESFDAIINTSVCRFGEPARDLPEMPPPNYTYLEK